MADAESLAFDDIGKGRHSPQGQTTETCFIITTPPVPVMQDVHYRTPITILPHDRYDGWLEPCIQTTTILNAAPRSDAVKVSNG